MAEEVTIPGVVLLGASSQIGIFTIPHLAAAGYPVYAVSRNPRPQGYPELAGVTWLRPEQLREVAGSITGLISAGPLTLAIDTLAGLSSLSRAVVFSTSSVRYKLDSPDAGERRLMRAITARETELRQLCEGRDLELSLLRPTLIYGCGMDENISRLAGWIRRFRLMPVAGAASGLRQPVHAEDLAVAAVAALKTPGRLHAEYFLSGGSTVTYREMIHAIASGLDVRVRLVPLPVSVLAFIVSAIRHLPRFHGVNPVMVRRQNIDLAFDDSVARELLAYAPRPFRPQPGDFHWPTAQCLRSIAARAQRGDSGVNDVKI